MDKYQNQYRIPTTRLRGYDYGSQGAYYLTICTKHRICFFGDIVETDNCFFNEKDTPICSLDENEMDNHPSLRATAIGKIAYEYWIQIPEHFPFVALDKFVIMPNHIHGILFFDKPYKTDRNPNAFGVQSQNLGSVIRAYKSSVKRYANENNIHFAWQERYHDRVIRDQIELNNVRNYISHNPYNWARDKLNR